MLQMMYSEKVIAEELLSGTVWELIIEAGMPCGYLSYSVAEGNSVKLSKIYIGGPFAADRSQLILLTV